MKRFAVLSFALLFVASLAIASPKKRLKATATSHSVTLTWSQGVVPAGATCPSGTGSTAVTDDKVYRGTVSGQESPTVYADIGSAATTFTDTNVVAGQEYFYEVTSVNCSGESAKSNEVAATIPNPLPPGAPTLNPPTVQ